MVATGETDHQLLREQKEFKVFNSINQIFLDILFHIKNIVLNAFVKTIPETDTYIFWLTVRIISQRD